MADNKSRAASSDGNSCGVLCIRPSWCQRFANINLFVGVMCVVIAIQGTYLGYIVGVLTSIERRFELSTSWTGTLLSMYDVGHTIAVVFVGYCGARRHKPLWVSVGVVGSAIAMLLLVTPNIVWGNETHDERRLRDPASLKCQWNTRRGVDPDGQGQSTGGGGGSGGETFYEGANYYLSMRPDKAPLSPYNEHDAGDICQQHTHTGAYTILALGQLLAGISAAPFNTLAYVYIDENVSPRQSPFFLGLLTSMYAFGPAVGFGLSAIANQYYVSIQGPPIEISISSPNWIGAWWAGFVLIAVLYLCCAPVLLLFPHRLRSRSGRRIHTHRSTNATESEMKEMSSLNSALDDRRTTVDTEGDDVQCIPSLMDSARRMPQELKAILTNRVYISMVIAWICGSYLVGGFGTYLPKYIETQYTQTASMADIYAGIISIGSVAVSTAVGGYLLSRLNISPRNAILCLLGSWSVILVTYLVGMTVGCQHAVIEGQHVHGQGWNLTLGCNAHCGCQSVHEYAPVCVESWSESTDEYVSQSFFSPCHAGCEYNSTDGTYVNCRCPPFMAPNSPPDSWPNAKMGICDQSTTCWHLPLYIAMMFVGLFIGNLFFITTMMIVLRSVHDEHKSLALSFASFLTNVLGFIPAPIILGALIDSACEGWHSLCPHQSGNCIVYDNEKFKYVYHLSNSGFQFVAIIAVFITYLLSRNFVFPEEEDEEEEYENVYEVDYGIVPIDIRPDDLAPKSYRPILRHYDQGDVRRVDPPIVHANYDRASFTRKPTEI